MVNNVVLFAAAVLLTGWLILAYLLATKKPQHFMAVRYRWILLVSCGLTASLWWLDNDPPYDNIWHTVVEIPLVGTMYCAVFFCIIAGINKLIAPSAK